MARLNIKVLSAVVILFMFYVSYKILEPEIEEHPAGRDTRDDQDYHLHEDELEVAEDDTGAVGKHADGDVGESPGLRNSSRQLLVERFLDMYQLNWNHTLKHGSNPWELAGSWVTHRSIHPEYAPEIGAILREMATRKILSADVGYRGTQLKITLVLKGGQRAVFKPKWFQRSDVITGAPYSGEDRHNGEIAAFHLNRLMGFRRTPLVVGRVIDLEKDIKPVAEQRLLETFYTKDGNMCFYGKCLYCKGSETGVCAEGSVMEGAVVLWLPPEWKFKNWRHPWGRTYRDGLQARWEKDSDYCSVIESLEPYASGPRLLDILDACVFDYIIGNADRHHYETFKDIEDSMLVMLDSAKSFGNPYQDEKSILTPLEQCCKLRYSTWERLQQLADGVLSRVLRRVLVVDPVSPVLAEPHFLAMDRRVSHILRLVDTCVERKAADGVFVRDKYSAQDS